ncbi:MAG: T9SS type A sorting domain-containing protein [Bacteroidota bacterium]
MKRLLVCLCAILMTPSMLAQAAGDNPWDLFPMAVGDQWEYRVTETGAFSTDTYLERLTVIGDTTALGQSFRILARTITSDSQTFQASRRYIRYDTTRHIGLALSQDPTSEVLLYPSRVIESCGFELPSCAFRAEADTVLFADVTPLNASYRRYGDIDTCGDSLFDYVAGIGLVRGVRDIACGTGSSRTITTSELRYARVGDREYGQAVFPTSETGEAPPTAAAISMSAYPNPHATLVSLRLSLAEASTVHFSIVDLLGREVWRSPSTELPSGVHSVPIQHARLSAGVYVAQAQATNRATGETRVVTARIVRQ